MEKQTIFVKVSGDLFTSPKFLKVIKRLAKRASHMLICVGGGTQINEALERAGFKTGVHGPLGRELKTTQERTIAKMALIAKCEELKRLLRKSKIEARVIVPILESGPVICHINGDVYIKTMYNGFDELWVFTTRERFSKKQTEFISLPKVRVAGI